MKPIILLILLSVGLREVEETEHSDLRLIYKNFAILSRITNAIAIETLVAKENISASDIISEYLNVPYHIFKSVVDVDVGKIRLAIDFAKKSIRSSNKKEYDDAFKNNMLSFLSKIDVLLKNGSNVLENAGKVRTENIFNEGVNIKSSNIVNNDCLKLDTGNLKEFGELFDMNNYWHLLRGNNYIEQVASNFKNQSTTLLNCLNNVAALAQSISSSTIWKAEAEYKDVETMRQIAAKFFHVKLNKTTFGKIEQHLLTILKSEMEAMKDTSTYDAVMTFRQAMNNSMVLSDTVIDGPPRYTFSFRRIKDLESIAGDIKSPWFNKHFVKNASTNELNKVIYPFINNSKKIRRIVKSWEKFFDIIDVLWNTNEWNVFYDYLTIVEQVYSTRDTINQSISNWKSLAENCIQLNYSNETLKTFADYERQQNAPLAIIRRISKLRSRVDKMNNQLHYLSKGSGSVFGIFKKHLSSVLNVKHSKDGPLIDRFAMKDLINQLGQDANTFIRTVKIATKLAENLQKLKNESESLKMNSNTITLNDVLANMNLTNAFKCIKDEGFNITFVFDWYRKYLEMDVLYRTNEFDKTEQYVVGLVNLTNSTSVFDSYMQHSLNDGERNQQTKYQLWNTTDPLALVHTLVVGSRVMRDMGKVWSNKNDLQNIGALTRYETNALKEFNLDEWQNMTELLKALILDVEKMNSVAGELRNANISNVTEIFMKASSIKGIPGTRANFNRFYRKMHHVSPEVVETKFGLLYDLHVELDFAARSEDLKNIPDSVNSIMDFFDGIFERKKKVTKDETPFTSIWVKIISACLGVIVLIVLGLLVYGLTESGRTNCQNLYLYYFVNWKVFEKRWRYSLFMDTIDMKNAILDAVRERNKTNLLKALKHGAYINVYNKFGNTALHVATRTGLPDFIDILIRYGADRSLLNARNLTPEEMIPPNFSETHSQDASKFEAIQAIYKKYKKKTFRIAVPQVFPVNSFHIWMDEKTDDKLTNAFMEKFPHIISDEAMPTTTHVIFHTDAGGIVEIDRLEQLIWIFHGAIIVKEQWMVDCVKDPKLIEHDSDYLVEKVKFNGVVYDTVLQWTEAMAKGTMPYLCGTYVAAVMKECPYLPALNVIVTNQGGVMMPSFPVKDDFNIGSHPYLHANLGPLFLIHDGTIDLAQYESDSDKMYTIFTKNEFITFLLKRQINRDTRKNPPPVSKDDI